MNRFRLRHILMESGLCIDSIRLLQWLANHETMRTAAFRLFRLRFSPAILHSALAAAATVEEAGELFSMGISLVNVGDTYKTTKRERSRLADQAILRLAAEYEAPALLEVGVSDGVSSLGLLETNGVFSRVVLTDKFSHFHEGRRWFGKVFLDSYRRLLGVKVGCLYCNLALDRPVEGGRYSRIETVNPVVEARCGVDAFSRFDILSDVMDEPVQIIKCANILSRCYFLEEQVLSAVRNLGRSLVEGGRLVVSHNNDKYDQGEAVLVLRKEGGDFRVEEDVNGHELGDVLRGDCERSARK